MTEIKYRLKDKTELEATFYCHDLVKFEAWLFENWGKCAEIHFRTDLPDRLILLERNK